MISSPENETISILIISLKVEKHILFDEDEVSTDPHLLSCKCLVLSIQHVNTTC